MTKLDKFIEQLKNIFGSRLKSVFVYGAKAGEKLITCCKMWI